MTEREQLWYLINEYQKGNYDSELFAREFSRIYDLEVDYDSLSKTEEEYFGKLSEITGRFTNDSEDLRIYPGVYFTEDDMKQFISQMLEEMDKQV